MPGSPPAGCVRALRPGGERRLPARRRPRRAREGPGVPGRRAPNLRRVLGPDAPPAQLEKPVAARCRPSALLARIFRLPPTHKCYNHKKQTKQKKARPSRDRGSTSICAGDRGALHRRGRPRAGRGYGLARCRMGNGCRRPLADQSYHQPFTRWTERTSRLSRFRDRFVAYHEKGWAWRWALTGGPAARP